MHFLFLLVNAVFSQLFNSEDIGCPNVLIGDGVCQEPCMMKISNFDSLISSSSLLNIFKGSDCLTPCLNLNCTLKMLEDDVCSEACNFYQCGWDLGKCGICSSGCTEAKLLNNEQDPECNRPYCKFDNGQYGWCALGCFKKDLEGKVFKKECNNTQCFMQNGLGMHEECSPGCGYKEISLPVCVKACDNLSCEFMLGKCLCSPGCDSAQMNSEGCDEGEPCNTEACSWKNGKCPHYCSEGCLDKMIGNGICEENCFKSACDWDGPDCSGTCAEGCPSTWNDGQWNHTGGCLKECLVETCQFNYLSCSEKETLTNAILTTFYTSSLKTFYNPCQCSSLELLSYNLSNPCNSSSPCYNQNCSYCLGFSNQTKVEGCIRYYENNCLIHQNHFYYRGLTVETKIMDFFSEVLETVPDLNGLVPEIKVYYLKAGAYAKKFHNFTIETSGNLSFAQALASCIYPYCAVKIGPGRFHFGVLESSNGKFGYVKNPYEPMVFSVDLYQKELHIEGHGDETIVYFETFMKFYSRYEKLYIKDITFSGQYLINSTCEQEICFYCPAVADLGNGYFKTDRNDVTDANLNYEICNLSENVIPFVFESATEIINTTFINFRNNAKYLINSNKNLTIISSTFEKIQNNDFTIFIECIQNCDSTEFNMKDSKVKDLNPGYEHTESLQLGGFFQANKIGLVRFERTSFEYLMAISSKSKVKTSLIYLVNIQLQIIFDECEFNDIYSEYIITVEEPNLNIDGFTLDKYNIRKEYDLDHIIIKSSDFSNVYARSDLVMIFMTNFKSNIYIFNCSFYEVLAGNNIFYINSDSMYLDQEINGKYVIEMVQKKNQKYYSPAKYLIMDKISVKSSKLSSELITIDSYPNIIIRNFNLESVAQLNSNDIFELIIKKFKESGKYLSLLPSSKELPSSTLKYIFDIRYCYKLNIESLELKNISLNISEFSIIYLENLKEIDIKTLKFSEVICSSKIPSLININSIDSLKLESIYLQAVENYGGFIKILDVISLKIINYYQKNTKNDIGESIYIENTGNITLLNIEFSHCIFDVSIGGAFSIISGDSDSILYCQSLKFNSIIKNSGRASIFFFDSKIKTKLNSFILDDIKIDKCSSSCSYFMITGSVNLKLARISNLVVSNSVGKYSFFIDDQHAGSQIKYINIRAEFINNFLLFYYGKFSLKDVAFDMLNATFDRCNFFYGVFFIDSLFRSTVIIKDLIIFDSNADFIASFKNFDVIIFNISINNNSGVAFGADNSKIFIEKSVFFNMRDRAFELKFSRVDCLDCIFNQTDSTFINCDENSSVNFSNSVFSKSKTIDTSILYCLNSENLSTFENCTFEDNLSYLKTSFSLENCKLSISNSKFKSIESLSDPSLLKLTSNSFANLTNCNFNFKPSYLISTYNSTTRITNCIFDITPKFNKKEGINHSELESNRQILSKLLKDVREYELIRCFEGSIEINSTIFLNPYGRMSVIYTEQSYVFLNDVKITNFTLTTSDSAAIYMKESKLTANLLKITNSFTYSSGIRLNESSFQEITVTNSTFSNISAFFGGGINIFNQLSFSKVSIKSCIFENNLANFSGGAIYAKSSTILLENSKIIRNIAYTSGGGIFYSSNDCSSCDFNISSSSITHNSCPEGEGGGIKWDKKPKTKNSKIKSNTAKYGNDFSSFPSKLVLRPSRVLTSNNEKITLAPGQEFQGEIIICMEDSYSNLYNSGSNSTGLLLSQANKSITLGGNLDFTSVNGCFNLTRFRVNGPPNTNHSINFKATAINEKNKELSDDDEEYKDFLEIPIFLRDCIEGESKGFMDCTKCLSGQYLFHPAKNCKDCPSNAKCPGGDVLLPNSGHWKVAKYTETIYPCLLDAACLGYLNETDFSGTCAKGYRGNLCATCEIGYSLSSSGKCSRCPSEGLNILVLMGLLTGIIALGVILVKSTLKSAFSSKNVLSVYIKIFTNYLQIVFLTTQFNLSWPEMVLSIFSVQKTAATAPDQVFSIDCYMKGKDVDSESQYYTKLMFIAFLPIAIFSACFIFWLFVSLVEESYRYLKREFFTSIIVLFFLVHPNISKVLFGSFSCKHLETIDYWLNDNLEVQCFTKNHWKYLKILSGPSIILWVLGFPAMLLVILVKRRRFLHLDSFKVIFGFLYNGYKNTKFYWEFIIMYRKILIISIILAMSSAGVAVQALTVNFLLIFSIYLQFYHHPFSEASLNKLEMQALITATLTIYSGLYFLTDDLNEPAKFVLFFVILLGNTYFLVFWSWYNFKALIDTLVVFLPALKRICKKGDNLGINFYEESIEIPGVVSRNESSQGLYTFRRKPVKNFLAKMEGIECLRDLQIQCMRERPQHLVNSEVSFSDSDWKTDLDQMDTLG